MSNKNFILFDVLNETIKFIKNNIWNILILLTIKVNISFLFYFILLYNFTVSRQIVTFYIVLIPFSIFINTYLTILIKNYYLNIPLTIKAKITKTIKNIFYYICGNLLILFDTLFIILLFIILSFIFSIYPIINIYLITILTLTLIIFLGYFRFLGYTAVLEQTSTKLYSKTYKYLHGHLIESILVLIIFGIISNIFFDKLKKVIYLNNIPIPYILIILFSFDFISLLSVIVDIIYITLGYKKTLRSHS